MTDRRSGQGRRKEDRWVPKVLPVYIAIVVTLLVAVTAYASQAQTRNRARENAKLLAASCLRSNRSDAILRDLVVSAVDVVARDPHSAQRQRLLARYREAERQLAPRGCPRPLGALVKQTQDRLDAALVAECRRVNLLRAQSNANVEASYRSSLSAYRRERALSTGPQAAIHAKSAHAILTYIKALRHTHLTDCNKAVYNPTSYTAPKPMPFPLPE